MRPLRCLETSGTITLWRDFVSHKKWYVIYTAAELKALQNLNNAPRWQRDSLDWFCMNTVLHRTQEVYFYRKAENYRQIMQMII